VVDPQVAVSSRKVVTVFVPADSKERSHETVIEFTVPIEAVATASPVAIVTSELASGTAAGLQLSASSQCELAVPVHVDFAMRANRQVSEMLAHGQRLCRGTLG
jgi:hypothetical protein